MTLLAWAIVAIVAILAALHMAGGFVGCSNSSSAKIYMLATA